MSIYRTEAWGIRRYIDDVASTLRVHPDARMCDFTKPANAYLALPEEIPTLPMCEFALLWHEDSGWAAAAEPDPSEEPIVLAYMGGDVLAAPREVAEFVEDVLDDRHPGSLYPPMIEGRANLRARLTEYAHRR